MTLKQVCNVSYAAQVETKLDEDELTVWLAELEAPTVEDVRRTQQSVVQGQLLDMMPIAEGIR